MIIAYFGFYSIDCGVVVCLDGLFRWVGGIFGIHGVPAEVLGWVFDT